MGPIRLYQVDAFADAVFGGNPAAVCPLDGWLPDETLQAIAAENNLSETAFFVDDGRGRYELRWFTPTMEVELCGHATLATAYVLFEKFRPEDGEVFFSTASGELSVVRRDELLYLDFPAFPAERAEAPDALLSGLGAAPADIFVANNYMGVFSRQSQVAALDPDFPALAGLYPKGVVATAPGEDCDFVSRFFAPAHGVPEDPVTGSAHCLLIPYWAARLKKTHMTARQISRRGGVLYCEIRGNRVGIGGRAALYLEGFIRI